MEPEIVPRLLQASYKSTQDQPRGFKPVISIPTIPIAIPASSYQSQAYSYSNQEATNISLQARVNNKYQQYLKLVKQNKLIRTTIEHVSKQKIELQQKYETLQGNEKSETDEKKKRHRRYASQITRNYQCPIENCDKSYGAQASLTQHVKLKHASYYGSAEYEKFMEEIIKKREKQNYQ